MAGLAGTTAAAVIRIPEPERDVKSAQDVAADAVWAARNMTAIKAANRQGIGELLLSKSPMRIHNEIRCNQKNSSYLS
jgi:hypothetical protein